MKPANILVKCQTLWLTDFGVSFQSDDDASRSGLLRSDHPGTADYCAPEQNERDSYVGTRADIFSLGCVFAEMAVSSTGSTPTAYRAARSRKASISTFTTQNDKSLCGNLSVAQTYLWKMLEQAEGGVEIGELIVSMWDVMQGERPSLRLVMDQLAVVSRAYYPSQEIYCKIPPTPPKKARTGTALIPAVPQLSPASAYGSRECKVVRTISICSTGVLLVSMIRAGSGGERFSCSGRARVNRLQLFGEVWEKAIAT